MTLSKSGPTDGKQVEKMVVDAYSPPAADDQMADNIVDVVCRIVDDDGPKPMRNLKPSQKTRNAAEQFDYKHQEAYETRGKQSSNRMEAVRLHNSGYPKMHDELNRKRSTAKVTMSATRRNVSQHTYNHCNTCIKHKKRLALRRKGLSSKNPSDTKRKTGPRRSSIRKPKSRLKNKPASPCRIYKLSRIRMTKGCQCSSYFLAQHKKSGTTDIPLDLGCQTQSMATPEEATFLNRDFKNLTECKKPSNTSHYSKESSKTNNPEPDSDGSVSSYDTFASLEHEPMVSN